jgi:cystathionine beta-lyase/cystathionine gamma-synthase
MKPDDICPRPAEPPPNMEATKPLATPITLTTVWQCGDPEQTDKLLGSESGAYVYSRDRNPNADMLAERCRELHGAERATVTANGMAAMSLALVSQCQSGDHVLISNRLYGKSIVLLAGEAKRLGISCTMVDICDLKATAAAMQKETKLLVVETISNPTLRVADIRALADVAHAGGAKLLVDNSFASPVICRPLELGADLVLESITKIMNGHSDVLLGLLCGGNAVWQRVYAASSAWGFIASPFECWLAERGIGTLHLRIERASSNALAAAKFLSEQKKVTQVWYPGLASHPEHDLSKKQFGPLFGSMVAFTLRGSANDGGSAAAVQFIKAAKRIPFCPSLGELCTTLSHPESTSHRLMSPPDRAALDIRGGTIRLSVGTESPEFVIAALEEGLAGVA